MSDVFKDIKKLPLPHTARSFPEMAAVFAEEDVRETVASFEAELAKVSERARELEKRNNNQSKTIEAMEGCIANEIAKAFEKAEIPLRAKSGCIGEFNFTIEDGVCCPECWNEQSDDCHMCNGNSDESGLSDLTATVPWDLCKSIWLRMNKIYAEQLRKEQE